MSKFITIFSSLRNSNYINKISNKISNNILIENTTRIYIFGIKCGAIYGGLVGFSHGIDYCNDSKRIQFKKGYNQYESLVNLIVGTSIIVSSGIMGAVGSMFIVATFPISVPLMINKLSVADTS